MKDFLLTGEYECKLDVKGRLRLPSALIRQIGFTGSLQLVINRGFENHLMLYPNEVWEKKTKEINQLNIYNTRERQAMRYFYRGASFLTMDANDRILLPKTLIEYSRLKKDVILFAYHEQIEIWSKEAYNEMLSKEPPNFSEVADGLFGGSKQNEVGPAS